MKSKTTLIIFAVILILIVLFLRNRSQKIPTIPYPPNTQNQITDTNTIQNGTVDQSTVAIDTDLQSLDNIVNGINNEDFASATLDGIE
ncbi:MAG TPA: hypothetical protein VJB63_00250 [Patescibacteria group bacterium]|nr:hypothetical protein [Patescibacteria group bacterium]